MSLPYPEELSSLCEVMVKYGLTRLTHGELTLERHPALAVIAAAALEEPKQSDEEEEADPLAEALSRVHSMSPDAQDRALMLTPVRGS